MLKVELGQHVQSNNNYSIYLYHNCNFEFTSKKKYFSFVNRLNKYLTFQVFTLQKKHGEVNTKLSEVKMMLSHETISKIKDLNKSFDEEFSKIFYLFPETENKPYFTIKSILSLYDILKQYYTILRFYAKKNSITHLVYSLDQMSLELCLFNRSLNFLINKNEDELQLLNNKYALPYAS